MGDTTKADEAWNRKLTEEEMEENIRFQRMLSSWDEKNRRALDARSNNGKKQ